MSKKYIEGLVSIIMPTYKRCDMLTRAIESVLNQTYKSIELIVVNDNEKNDDYSQKLYTKIEKYKNDGRFCFLEQEKHINGAVARNIGIRHARGQYIAFLDDDDTWIPEKIEIQVKELKKLDDSWGAVSCLKKYYNKEGCFRASLPYRDGDIFKDVLMFLTNITTGTILIRHIALDDSGYFDETLNRQQDIQLFACLSKKYKIKLVKKYLLNIDISDGQNRPNLEKFWSIKEAYISSIRNLIDDNIEKVLRKHIAFSYGIMLLQNRKIIDGLVEIMKCLAFPRVFYKETKYYIKNLLEIVLKKRNIRKYR